MIVNELELGPFAGISGKKVIKFDNGLNIILGPNEAGKSTFVEALLSLFFLPIKPRKRSTDDENIKNLLPMSGGDTIKAGLSFKQNGEIYVLSVVWGKNPSIELKLPNGNLLTDENGVREKLDELLAYGPATYKNVLISRQADMALTIRALKSNSEATTSLGKALRRTMFEADGVSVDVLRERIEDERKNLLNNWDLHGDGPEKDRSYDNQWRSKGEVLKAYYELEGQRRKLTETRQAEENYSKISSELTESRGEIEILSVEVNKLKSISGDIWKRKEFEPKLALLKTQEEKLKKDNREWPVVEKDTTGLESSIKELTERKGKLEAELSLANAAIKSQSIRALYNKAESIHIRIQELKRQTDELPNIERDNLKELKRLENEIETCKAALSAGKLSGRFSSKQPMNLTVQKDLDDSENISLKAGEEISLNAGGQIIVESEGGWEMELRSGEQDIENIRKNYGESKVKLEQKKSELKADSVNEVEQSVKKKEEIERSLELEKGNLKTLLEGKPFDSLKTEFDNLGEKGETRDPDQIRKELRELDSKQNKSELELQNLREKLEEWKQEYGGHDKVFERLGGLNSQRKEIEKELEKLAPLPEVYDNADIFQKDLEEKEQRLQRLKQEENELKIESAKAEANLPDESTEYIEKALKLYEKEFWDLKNRAIALIRVQAVFKKVVDELDANPYGPLLESFASYLAPLTANRYKSSSMSGALPSGIIKEDGTEIPIDLLSTGTGDGTAIALRLAMAEYLLQGRKGFMIMDDPLVNLDPERRKAAAGVLRGFANKFQTIITTCDPNTADLLGGNLIRI